jgi:ABC-type sugar transport system ATPase subunit
VNEAVQTIDRTPRPEAGNDIVIDVEGLTKSFDGRTVVKNLTMQVRRGLIYGFLGPNGSGKTTTIRMLCGLLTPDAGRGTCLGFDIRTQSAEIKRHVGYMTQRFSLYADLSIRENLEFVARVYGLPRPREAARQASPVPISPASPNGSGTSPASTWWRRSARRCTSAAAMPCNWTRQRSRCARRVRRHGRAARPPSRTCSST